MTRIGTINSQAQDFYRYHDLETTLEDAYDKRKDGPDFDPKTFNIENFVKAFMAIHAFGLSDDDNDEVGDLFSDARAGVLENIITNKLEDLMQNESNRETDRDVARTLKHDFTTNDDNFLDNGGGDDTDFLDDTEHADVEYDDGNVDGGEQDPQPQDPQPQDSQPQGPQKPYYNEEGAFAFANGEDDTDNPYDADGDEYVEWLEGYRYAEGGGDHSEILDNFGRRQKCNQEGQFAFADNKHEADNPYIDTAKRADWLIGYRYAEEEAGYRGENDYEEEGRNAFEDRMDERDNPYKPGNDGHIEWLAGYNAAEEDRELIDWESIGEEINYESIKMGDIALVENKSKRANR